MNTSEKHAERDVYTENCETVRPQRAPKRHLNSNA